MNDNLVLISGSSGAGKSVSLMNIENPEGVIYLNTESGKRLPFRSKFKEKVVTDPNQIMPVFDYAEEHDDIHTIVVDSLTFLMDMYESIHVLRSSNTMKAWSNYAQFFKELMQEKVANSSKNVIFTAHVLNMYNENDMVMETKIPVKGALKNNGLEASFSINLMAVKKTLVELEKYSSDLLTITPQEEALGFKHCFLTQVTKETINTRIRTPMGLFSPEETYINNDIQLVLNRLKEYYK